LVNLTFDQYKVSSFKQKVTELLNYNPDAVLVAPVYKEAAVQLAGELGERNIPYVFIDSNIEGVNNLSYFGQHSYQSGFMAARLLEMGLPEKASIAIIKPSKANISNQVVSREKGFRAFFENAPIKGRYHLLSVEYDLYNETGRKKQLLEFFASHPSISATVVFNSMVYEIAAIVEQLKLKNIRLIGYDLLRENAEYLRKGTVTFLLAQRPEEQGYFGIMTLFNYLAFHTEVEKVQYVPIDILTKENLDYYINFNK
jgi:LacI family transcriptional regulator